MKDNTINLKQLLYTDSNQTWSTYKMHFLSLKYSSNYSLFSIDSVLSLYLPVALFVFIIDDLLLIILYSSLFLSLFIESSIASLILTWIDP